MYSNFDFKELERATQENLARIYKESLDSQEYKDPQLMNETYKKVRQILECPEMEKCHPYLYSLDMDDFNDQDTEKINKIYQLGLDRGMFQKDDSEGEVETPENCENGECDCEDSLCGGPKDSLTGQEMVPQHLPSPRKPIYTVMYSAQKDGHGAMGEFYSMAPTIEGAKEDCLNQMGASGYEDVMIMAVDTTYPGVEDDVDDSWVDRSLDNVSPNLPVPTEDEEDTIQEDDSEEFLKQETGDTSTEEEENKEEQPPVEKEEPEQTEGDNSEGNEESEVENSEEPQSEEDSTDGTQEETEENSDEQDGSEESNEEDASEGEDTDDKEDGVEDQEDEEKKLTAEEKSAMQTLYTKTFKDVLRKQGLEKSVSEMTLEERTDFYEKLSEKWDKNDPSDFMDDKDQEKLNKIVVKPDAK